MQYFVWIPSPSKVILILIHAVVCSNLRSLLLLSCNIFYIHIYLYLDTYTHIDINIYTHIGI